VNTIFIAKFPLNIPKFETLINSRKLRFMKNHLIILTVGLLLACNGKKEATEVPPQQIEVIEVLQQDVPIYSELVGQIYGYKDIPIRARVDGFLNNMSFQEGSSVSKGQLLYSIDSDPFDADVAARQSRVAEAKTMMVNAKNELDRYIPLAKINAVSKSDLDAAQANYDASISTVKAAQANLDAALINQGYCRIYAPIDGIIGKTEARVGEYVGKEPNPVILTTVSRIDTVRVQFSISEAKYLQLSKKYAAFNRQENSVAGSNANNVKVELLLADNSTYQHHGKIDFVNNVIDPNTGSLLVQASFENPEYLLRPGLYAKVRIQLDVEKNALVIPQRCVTELQGEYSVFVVDANNVVSSKSVEIGNRYSDMITVTGGLQAGDKVVIDGLQKVSAGQTIAPIPSTFKSKANAQ
jgi:membrane fusion protein (multidrug efflux system)